MKKILLFVVLVCIVSRPQINTAMAVPGANEQAFTTIVENTLALLFIFLVLKIVGKVLSLFVRGMRGGYRVVARKPAPSRSTESAYARDGMPEKGRDFYDEHEGQFA